MIVLGWFFLGEGSIALGYAGLRGVCVRGIAPGDVPPVLRRRIAAGDRMMPAVIGFGAIAFCIGLVITLVTWGVSD